MKKIFKVSFLLMIIALFSTGCEGDVTRALRHEGFAVGSEFACDAFFNGEASEKVRYLTSSKIITTAGRIYDVSLGQKFSNNLNCKISDTNLKVVSIFDDKVFKADDGKIYTLNEENNSKPFTEVTSADNSYGIYQLLLGPEGTIKAQTADSGNGIYYVLKSDGNVYGITITQTDRNAGPSIVGSVVVYNRNDFGGAIVDFNYNGNSAATFVRTEMKVFKMNATNLAECSKYADIACNYEMMEATFFEEYGEYVLAYNGGTVITTYKKIFTVTG